ncbi:MAG: DUF2061 domain-containing protein [Kiritimatiellia bacterium]
MESRRRSFIKAITWRICGLFFTFLVGLIVTRSFRISLIMGVTDFFLKIGTFYGHERLWSRIRWGRLLPEQIVNEGDIL